VKNRYFRRDYRLFEINTYRSFTVGSINMNEPTKGNLRRFTVYCRFKSSFQCFKEYGILADLCYAV